MSWIRAFVELTKSLLLKGFLLLMSFLLGRMVGQPHLQRRWDAEKQTVQIAQAKQAQHAADVAHVQNQISKEVSDDYRKKSSLLASRSVVFVPERVLYKPEISFGGLSSVSGNASGVASTSSHGVSPPGGVALSVNCEQLSNDAAQTTLMLLEIQRWYLRTAAIER
jgi:hypothetical protein